VTIAVRTGLKACTAFVVARWKEWWWRDALSVQIKAQLGRLASGATGASIKRGRNDATVTVMPETK
jgi:hypothetical protein